MDDNSIEQLRADIAAGISTDKLKATLLQAGGDIATAANLLLGSGTAGLCDSAERSSGSTVADVAAVSFGQDVMDEIISHVDDAMTMSSVAAVSKDTREMAAPMALRLKKAEMEAAWGALQTFVGSTQSMTRHPLDPRWVLVRNEVSEFHSDSTNPSKEEGTGYILYDLARLQPGELPKAVWSTSYICWYVRGGWGGTKDGNVRFAPGVMPATLIQDGKQTLCTELPCRS